MRGGAHLSVVATDTTAGVGIIIVFLVFIEPHFNVPTSEESTHKALNKASH